jgi:hypothetical protein
MSQMKTQRGVLVGLGAVVGAFAVAALTSGVAAPAAHADDFSDLLTDVEALYAAGTTAFGDAASDFAGGTATDSAYGFEEIIDGVDDDSVLAPFQFIVGGAQLLDGDSISVDTPFGLSAPIPDLATGLTDASDAFQQGLGAFAVSSQDLASSDWIDALQYALDGSYLTTIAAPEEVLEGAFDQALGL